VLESNGMEARFVGGCIRDAILGIRTEDFDVAVNGSISKIIRVLQESNIRCIPLDAKYGSVVVIMDDIKYEITSLRKDKNCRGRHCDVAPVSSFEEDAGRRDFTMNAIYVAKNGGIYDYFDGIEDLKKREVIFIGKPEDRIEEDYLRIFRYYRFCADLGDLSDRYAKIIKKAALNIPKKLSIERVQKEMILIAKSENAVPILEFIDKNGVFKGLNIEGYKKLCDYKDSLSICVKLYTLFGADILLNVFKLPKTHKKQYEDFKNFENESPQYCAYKKGLKFYEDMALIKYVKFGISSEFPAIEQMKFARFPLDFSDLPPNVSFAARKLAACERWWAEHDFQKSREDCLNFIDINKNF
jgi:tRNA nucleotidyltransferase/poly(A) polymerase